MEPSHQLRPYQAECVKEMLNAYHAGCRRILLVAPTGSGKTRMAVEFLAQAGLSALALAPRVSIVDQIDQTMKDRGVGAAGEMAADDAL